MCEEPSSDDVRIMRREVRAMHGFVVVAFTMLTCTGAIHTASSGSDAAASVFGHIACGHPITVLMQFSSSIQL